MRAYRLPKGGAGIDALTRIERSTPKPGHRQVLVKVAACSLNFRDLGIVRGCRFRKLNPFDSQSQANHARAPDREFCQGRERGLAMTRRVRKWIRGRIPRHRPDRGWSGRAPAPPAKEAGNCPSSA